MEFLFVLILICVLQRVNGLSLGLRNSCGVIGDIVFLDCSLDGATWNSASTRQWRVSPPLTLLFNGGSPTADAAGYQEHTSNTGTTGIFSLEITSLTWSHANKVFQCAYALDTSIYTVSNTDIEDYKNTIVNKTEETSGLNIKGTITLDAIYPVPTVQAILTSSSNTDISMKALTNTTSPAPGNLTKVVISVNHLVNNADDYITVNLSTPCGYSQSFMFNAAIETTTITAEETTTTSQTATEPVTTITEPLTSPQQETTDSVTTNTKAKTTRSYSETTTKSITSNVPEGGQTTTELTTTPEAASSSGGTTTGYTSTTNPSKSPVAGEEIIIIVVCSVVGFIIIVFIFILAMFVIYKKHKNQKEKQHKREHKRKREFQKQQENTFDDIHAWDNWNKYDIRRENEDRHIAQDRLTNKTTMTSSSYTTYQRPRGYDYNKYNNTNTLSTYYPSMYGGSHNYGFEMETSPYEQNYQFYTGSTHGSSYCEHQKLGRSGGRHHERSGGRHHGRYQGTQYQSYPAVFNYY